MGADGTKRIRNKSGNVLVVPEIADYEVRRELLRADKLHGIDRLNLVKTTFAYLPITTAVMLKAAEFWAETRKRGRPTADNAALHGFQHSLPPGRYPD